ncbi:MAG: hypothetical protein II970_07830 [Paludibacteraceae bacterium]|nr:hypothetical protein [Paludibacteraceae bacterium]
MENNLQYGYCKANAYYRRVEDCVLTNPIVIFRRLEACVPGVDRRYDVPLMLHAGDEVFYTLYGNRVYIIVGSFVFCALVLHFFCNKMLISCIFQKKTVTLQPKVAKQQGAEPPFLEKFDTRTLCKRIV